MQQIGPFLQVGQKGYMSIYEGNSMKMAPYEERGPGHSEQYTWCTCWNGDQTRWTSHAYMHLCGPELHIE